MNLDDFKIQIKQKLENETSFEMPVTSISANHFSNQHSVLEKIKRSLRFEIFCGILFVLFFSFIAYLSDSNSIKIYFNAFSVIIVLFTCVLAFMYYKTKNVNFIKLSVKQNLYSLHQLISTFVKRCFQFTMLLIPICFASAILLAYNEMQYSTNNYDVPIPTNYLLIILLIVIVFSVFVYYFTKWYLKKLYGNNLAELKAMIDELD